MELYYIHYYDCLPLPNYFAETSIINNVYSVEESMSTMHTRCDTGYRYCTVILNVLISIGSSSMLYGGFITDTCFTFGVSPNGERGRGKEERRKGERERGREGEIERERLKSPQLGSPHSQLTWFGGSLCVPVESMDV